MTRSTSLTVLSVGYPLAPVGPDAVGGSEQVLYALDRALVAAGQQSIVVACEGSSVNGTLVATPRQAPPLEEGAREAAWPVYRDTIAAALRNWPVDVVHMHGLDFWAYLPAPGVPVLATLHLPPWWYPGVALWASRPETWLNCVSEAQHRMCHAGPILLAPIENGVPVHRLSARHAKRRFALFLGRICPEKGIHLAIEAAERAQMPLLIGGEVFPYEEHRRYFAEEIAPRLSRTVHYLGALAFARKRRLLTAAQCVLVPSLVDETSSLVAREAVACGTPVIAFPRGALPETVEHGRTGFLVETVEEMAAAMVRSGEISSADCRETALRRFSVETMTDRYFGIYQRLASATQVERRSASA